MAKLPNYPKILLGKHNNEKIYLSAPSWECGWHWGFGYLGNKNCHYHVSGLKKIETYDFEKKVWQYEFVNLYDGLKKHFGDSFIVKKDADIWALAELFATFYALKEVAEIYHRGGSHYANNPAADIIKNEAEVTRINEKILPAVFAEIYRIFAQYAK